MDKVHLGRGGSHMPFFISTACGLTIHEMYVDAYTNTDLTEVTCMNCIDSLRYAELKELDKTMSEIKTEDELKFDNELEQAKAKHPAFDKKPNSHYNQSSTPTIEKINEVLDHLEGKINNKQSAQIYNALKYWDRCEHKEDKSKDLFKCADSIFNSITGKFINEVK